MKGKGNGDTLERILDEVWRMLKRGVTRFNDPFHWPVLGTVGKEGCSMRSVILRRFIEHERILVCHTDSRAGKVEEISTMNKVSWHFYHPKKMVQLRITGGAELHSEDPFADDQWAATRITSRLNYCSVQAPGTPVDKPSSGLPDFLMKKVPSLLESEKGRENFMVIAGKIETLDWLRLSLFGNRRARFTWDEGNPSAKWLIP